MYCKISIKMEERVVISLQPFYERKGEDFCKSLYIDGFSINFAGGWDKSNIDLYLCCSPDYFAYHCISISIDENKSVECNDLAG
ncbi:DUF2262 domain-containing protein [Clostridium sp. ZBS4]|uniref:DUF2262 domain-containing protein n=1 Tax=Clostridium sp. ZBS4 TaxID=2949974 RepID=UPI0009ABEB13|nr:DUF2262 domain-containing protein [Clostridium sp. ZBS4]